MLSRPRSVSVGWVSARLASTTTIAGCSAKWSAKWSASASAFAGLVTVICVDFSSPLAASMACWSVDAAAM